MTIDKAIEILEYHLVAVGHVAGPDYPNAIKLGVEALIRVKGNRKYPQPTVYPLLPGETEE